MSTLIPKTSSGHDGACGGPQRCVDCARDSISDALLRRLAAGDVPECFTMTRACSIAIARLLLAALGDGEARH